MKIQNTRKSVLDMIMDALYVQNEVTKVTTDLTCSNNTINMVTSEGLQEVIEEVPPLVTFRSMSKQPDQCLGGYCQWFRFDDQSKCVMADILTSDSQCPQGRWRLLKSETLNQKSETCIVCSSTDWWRIKNQNTEWICAVCHPPILSENFCEKK